MRADHIALFGKVKILLLLKKRGSLPGTIMQNDDENKGNSKYALGPLPWEEENLKIAYFSNFKRTRKAIEEHPGFLAHHALKSIRLSLDIFLDSTADLMESIDLFIKESEVSEFWTRPKKERFNKLELSIRRGVFSAIASAMALVDNSRNISKKFTLPDYQSRIHNTFENNEEHRFIQDLRNFVSHFKMIEVDWRVSWSGEGKHTQFLLQQKKLLCWDGWKPLARKFIEESLEGIDLKILFENYKTRVEEFQFWFHTEIERFSQAELFEYRRYERLLNKFEFKSFWDVIFKQIMRNKKIDPYQYLGYYLNSLEIDEVLSLPMNSRIQVDRIIAILDEYGVCDEELRRWIYLAFKVQNSSR
ncbi:MAG: hypothetical protein PHO30_03500 [Candidatus Omnitrophica bacterium]|nr:hypothetical protein [Candidatus Omnitrophota bacterium]